MLKLTLALLAVGASAIRVAEECDDSWYHYDCFDLYYRFDCESWIEGTCQYIVTDDTDSWYEYHECGEWEDFLTLCDGDDWWTSEDWWVG